MVIDWGLEVCSPLGLVRNSQGELENVLIEESFASIYYSSNSGLGEWEIEFSSLLKQRGKTKDFDGKTKGFCPTLENYGWRSGYIRRGSLVACKMLWKNAPPLSTRAGWGGECKSWPIKQNTNLCVDATCVHECHTNLVVCLGC